MKISTDELWDKIDELNTLHKQTVTSIYAIINEFGDIPHAHTGKAIRQKRKERKLTQSDMAEKVGCSRNYMAMIEKMESIDSVSFGNVCGVARVLDMNLHELVN